MQVGTTAQIGSVPRLTIEQEEQLKMYSRNRAPAQIGSVPKWTAEQEEQLKVSCGTTHGHHHGSFINTRSANWTMDSNMLDPEGLKSKFIT